MSEKYKLWCLALFSITIGSVGVMEGIVQLVAIATTGIGFWFGFRTARVLK